MPKPSHIIVNLVLAILLLLSSLPVQAQGADSSDLHREEVEKAIARAQEYLLAAQNERGYWDGTSFFYTESEPDLIGTTALYVFFLCHVGIDNPSRKRAVSYLISSQRSDGSWGDSASDFMAVLALEQAGLSSDSPTLRKAYQYIKEHKQRLQDQTFFTLFNYALAGEYSWPDIDFSLLDNTGQHSADKKPNAFRMDPALSFYILKTLYVPGGPSREQRAYLKKAESLLLQRQLPDGSWFNFEQGTIFALTALYELGYDTNDERFVKGLQFLNSFQFDDGSMAIFRLPIFDTAVALLALQASGIDTDRKEIRRASQWLVESRNLSGGWGWTPESGETADIDDTTLPVPILLEHEPAVADDVISFIFRRQNDDGGWGTFERDWSKQRDVKWIPLDSDLLFFSDPSIPEGTGHALLALGRTGYTLEDERIEKAVDYLQRVQFDNGMWLGWWGIPYIYGTSAVLTGLEAVGVDMQAAWIQKAVAWLEDCQNADGGWGEDLKARESPEYACMGDSTSSQTAWAILGLLAAGVSAESPVIQKGISYLVSQQRADGSWPWVRTMLATPPFPYSLENAETSWPLWALSSYRSAIEGEVQEPETQVNITLGVLVLLVSLVAVLVFVRVRVRNRSV